MVLAPGISGSQLLLEVLAKAARDFPEVLGDVRLPSDRRTFKRIFGELLVRFEASRAASSQRVEIARSLVQALHERILLRRNDQLVPLAEHLQPGEALSLDVVGGRGQPGTDIDIPWRQRSYSGPAAVRELAASMREESLLTVAAQRGLDWMADRLESTNGRLELQGQRFALLGAAAELAPTELLLEAGADVLWIDRAPVPQRLLEGAFSGRLHFSPGRGAIDLLAEPASARAAILAFAEGGPVHLGLYAYAPGRGRELRLAAVMDAIARSLPAGAVRSIATLVSPTTPGEVQIEDRAAAIERHGRAEVWKKAFERTRILKPDPHYVVGDTAVSRTVVQLQGPTYQAAQYLAKMMAAESLLAEGVAGEPVAISANVAGITATRSLLHPLFQAGFLIAPRFGIEIYQPATTRVLSNLLMLHDVLNEAAPGAATSAGDADLAERARRLAAQSIHGGCRSLSWVLEPTIRMAAVLGLGKQPSLLKGLLPRRKKR